MNDDLAARGDGARTTRSRSSRTNTPAALVRAGIMTNFKAFLAVAGSLASPAAAFLPVPATWSRYPAVTVAANDATIAHPSIVGGKRGKVEQLVMKKEPSARGAAKAGAKGAADEAGDPRRQALDGVLHQIERCYGRGSILKMGDTTAMDIETSSTGE